MGTPKVNLETFNDAGSIFIGNVVRIDSKRDHDVIILEVMKEYRNANKKKIKIINRNTSCALFINKSTSWLIYAHKYKGDLHVNRCSGSIPTSNHRFVSDTITLEEIAKHRDGIITDTTATGSMRNGEPYGTWTYHTISTESQEKSVGKYKNGKKSGVWKETDENGSLVFEQEFKNGILRVNRSFYNSGIIRSERRYASNGDKSKLDRTNYENGLPIRIFKSKFFGLWTKFLEYYPSGILKEKGKFNALGGYRGKWKEYGLDGRLIRKYRPG